MRVLYLVDSERYVRENCFQSQLLNGFMYCGDLDILQAQPELRFRLSALRRSPAEYDAVVCVLRQRTAFAMMRQLADFLGAAKVAVYDQDPWESFIDGSPTKGFYRLLNDSLNAEVFVTSRWWADRISKSGIDAHFVRMGMEPRWCDAGPAIEMRPVELGFKGHLHPHREAVFVALANEGMKVDIAKDRLNYAGYMSYLHNVQVFTHDESAPWICDGEEISRSTGMWIKDIETAARGTFTLRNWHPEAVSYGLNDIPNILFYADPREAPDKMAEFRRMSIEQRNAMRCISVERIRRRYDWPEAAQTILRRVVETNE
ncbi:MAG: hypothetical protein O9320_20590 [Magnetospirillum sp.]|nr:hypothetical protein [Magnetospirillum sp.]